MKRLLFAIAKVMSELYVLAKGIVFPIFANKKIKITGKYWNYAKMVVSSAAFGRY
jgi:hypothetical protein